MASSILIVDDDLSSRETIESILDGQGYVLNMSENGLDALKKAVKLQPDLILLDVMMPEMDGFETCQRIRTTPGLAEVPIIMLTALDDSTSRLRGITAGADDFLSKPVDRQELRARVRTVTRLNRYRTLLDQRENLRIMAKSLVTAQEAERLRISRELHDDLGQALTAHLIGLRLLSRDLPLPQEALQQRIEALVAETLGTLTRMRHLAQELRPPAVDTLDLCAALETYCQDFSARSRLPVEFRSEPLPLVTDMVAVTLYRFLQETLTNILKHAQAVRVWVELSLEEDNIILTVQDNGKGFNPDVDGHHGIGLRGLRERLTLAGGVMTLRSAPGHGTIITARLPLQRHEEEK